MAKAFSGAVALGLVSDGKLKLTDTVGDWIPELLPKAEERHARAGAPAHVRASPSTSSRTASSTADRGSRRSTSAPQVSSSPSSMTRSSSSSRAREYEYSDTDNIVVGLIAEKASGKSYEHLLASTSIGPPACGRRRCRGRCGCRARSSTATTCPKDEPPFDTSELINPAGAWASGGIVSTARDMNDFFRAYVGGELFSRRVGAGAGRLRRRLLLAAGAGPQPGDARALPLPHPLRHACTGTPARSPATG